MLSSCQLASWVIESTEMLVESLGAPVLRGDPRLDSKEGEREQELPLLGQSQTSGARSSLHSIHMYLYTYIYTHIHKRWHVCVPKTLSSSDVQALSGHEVSDTGITHTHTHTHMCTCHSHTQHGVPYAFPISLSRLTLDSKATR